METNYVVMRDQKILKNTCRICTVAVDDLNAKAQEKTRP